MATAYATGEAGVTSETVREAWLGELRPALAALRADVQAFLALPDSFAPPGGLDADMVLCAVLSEATPKGLAAYAARGADEEALVDALLGDALLMRDMLVAGGANILLYSLALLVAGEDKAPIISGGIFFRKLTQK